MKMEKAHDVNTQHTTLIPANYRAFAFTMSKTELIVATAEMAFNALINTAVKFLKKSEKLVND